MSSIITNLTEIAASLNKISEHSEQIYWLSNSDMTKLLYINPAVDKVFGRSRNLLYKNIRESWLDYVLPEDVQHPHPFEAMAEQVEKLGAKARFDITYRIKRSDKQVRWLVDRGAPICDATGIVIGISGIVVDVSEDKKILEHFAAELPEISRKTVVIQSLLQKIQEGMHLQNNVYKSVPSLTNRELQCIMYLMKGYRNKLIAKHMMVSPRTIEYHIENIKKKYNYNNISQLIDRCWQAIEQDDCI